MCLNLALGRRDMEKSEKQKPLPGEAEASGREEAGRGIAPSNSHPSLTTLRWVKFRRQVQYFTMHIDEDNDLLPAAERGLYYTLQKAYIQHGGPLPAHWNRLYAMARAYTDVEKRALRSLMPKRFTPIQDKDGRAYWVSSGFDREVERIASKLGMSTPYGAVDGASHGQENPLNNQQSASDSEGVKSKEVNKEAIAKAISSYEFVENKLIEEAADSNESVPAPPTPTTRVGADTSLLKHTSQLKGEPPPSVPAGSPPLEQSRCLGYRPSAETPWGEGKQWHSYEEWNADPATGYAPTEEERERTEKAEFLRKLRNGDFFVH